VTVLAEGYAMTGGSRRIERVEVSADGGGTWVAAALRGSGQPGTWRLWRAELEVGAGRRELVVRAWDSSGGVQPASVATTWNPKGYMNNAWHRIAFDMRAAR
jgi:sulfite oxidase